MPTNKEITNKIYGFKTCELVEIENNNKKNK